MASGSSEIALRVPPICSTLYSEVRREPLGGDTSEHLYVLYLYSAQRPVLYCTRKKAAIGIKYMISTSNPDSGNFAESQLAMIESNLSGTKYMLFQENSGLKVELAVIEYERNLLGLNGPRRLTVTIPAKTGEKSSDKTHLSDRIADEAIVLKNKEPIWNEESGSFVLNFNGRVSQASIKNFQLVTARDQDYIVALFGKMSNDRFALDFAYPLNALVAFAIAMTTFDRGLFSE